MTILPKEFRIGDPASIEISHIVDYFNLEDPGKDFTSSHFKYVGMHDIGGRPVMFWSVKGEDICATVEEHGDSFVICMDYLPD